MRPFPLLVPAAFLLALLWPGNGVSYPATDREAPVDSQKLMQARTHLDQGMKLLQKGSDAEAENEFLEAVRDFPDIADAYVQLGSLSMRRKDYSQALDRFLQARTALINLQGISRRQEVERARRLQDAMDMLREQIDQLRVSQDPADQSEINQKMTELDRLRQEHTKLTAHGELQVPAEIPFLIGTARMNLEDYDGAVEDYQEALSLRPGYGEAHNNLAVIYFYRKDYPKAWEQLHAAEKAGIRINPQFREELSAAAPETPPQPSSPPK
jgi:tetratricopeptide (TPR) repeat protein